MTDAGNGQDQHRVAGLGSTSREGGGRAHSPLVVVELAVGTRDVLGELFAGEGLTRVLSQEYHQPKLGRREVEFAPSASDSSAVSAVTVVLSGFLISQVVARAFGIAVTSSAIWHSVHSLAADATIALLLLHFALHATWMASAFRGMLQHFDPQGSPAPGGAARTTTAADLSHPRT